MKRSTIARAKMGFRRHRKSIKSPTRIGRKFVEGVIILMTPSLIDLMSFGWLFLGGLLPSRARLRFTSYQDCATLKSATQNGAAKSKTLRLDFFREATNRFRLGFYVRQRGPRGSEACVDLGKTQSRPKVHPRNKQTVTMFGASRREVLRLRPV